MRLNLEGLKNLLNEHYNGNYHAFARALNCDVAAIYKIINGQTNAGLKTINKIIEFLKVEKFNIEEYIFLP